MVVPWLQAILKISTSQTCLNIAGFEEFLLGIHLFDTSEGGHTRGITKSKFIVDIKVGGHGWRRRNSTNNLIHSLKRVGSKQCT